MQSSAIYTDTKYLQCKIKNENDFHLWVHLIITSNTDCIRELSSYIFLFIHIPFELKSIWVILEQELARRPKSSN